MAKRFLSLFSGCGGLDLGFIKAGLTPLAAFDSWSLAVEHYRRNVGPHAEVWDLARGTLPRGIKCDVVVAGSPCQGFSTAGKRVENDPRNSLLAAAVKIAIDVRPKAIVFENVPGLAFGGHRRHLERATQRLNAAGYKTSSVILNALDVGLPQNRKRIILFAWRTAGEIIELSKATTSLTLDSAIQNVDGLPNHDLSIGRLSTDQKKIAKHIKPGQKLCNVRNGANAVHTWDIPEVFGQTSKVEKKILETLLVLRRRTRVRSFGDADPVSKSALARALHLPTVEHHIARLIAKGYMRRVGNRVDLTNTFNGKYRRLVGGGISSTVDTKFGQGRNFLHPTMDRGFSVREAARIQGFPDSYVFHGSMTDQYKLVGNAVPPSLGHEIARMLWPTLQAK